MSTRAAQQARQALEAARAGRHRLALAAVTAIVTVTGLGACAAAGSWATVSALAADHGIGLSWLAPVEIDGGLVGVILVDIALTWAGIPLWWLRLAARVFGCGTVAANAAAGWPSPVGAGLRCAAPLLIVVLTEAGRAALLHPARADERARRAEGRRTRRAGRVPAVRWVLDPGGTFALWRRMRLWDAGSYSEAVSMELERRAAVGELAARFGADGWRSRVPGDLVWMLDAGVRMTVALERVRGLAAAGGRAAGEPGGGGGRAAATSGGVQAQASAGSGGRGGRRAGAKVDEATVARARELMRVRPEFARPGMGAEWARELALPESTGRRLLKRVIREAGSGAGEGGQGGSLA